MQPSTHGSFIVSVERLSDCILESGALFDAMWAELEGGHTSPDWGRWIILERQGELLNITVRDAEEAGAMVGYARIYLRHSITTGKPFAEEDMVYLRPECRGTQLVRVLREFVEKACAFCGFHDLYATARINSGTDRLLIRNGYLPEAAKFHKVI